MRFAAALLVTVFALAACEGFVPTASDPDRFIVEVASKLTDTDCVAKALEWGDQNHDGVLTRKEFIDLTLVAFDNTRLSQERAIATIDARKAAGKTVSPSSEARRAELAAKVRASLAQRATYEIPGGARFDRHDADRDGRLDRRELDAACMAARAEGRE